MEVHHHSHHPKKFKEYITEFVMLFAAVTLGFFAENFREHIVEGKREEAFMKGMVEDLKIDTSRMNYSINRLKTSIKSTDSLMLFYESGNYDKTNSKKFANAALASGFSVDVVFSDRTSSQLKGTGSFRLIRSKQIADSMMMYWNGQQKLDQIHTRYEETRQKQKECGYKTFVWYISYFTTAEGKLNNPTPNIDYILNRGNLPEFMNATATLYNVAKGHYMTELTIEKNLAIQLIKDITREYHLEEK